MTSHGDVNGPIRKKPDPESEVSIWTEAYVPIKGAEKLASQPGVRDKEASAGKVTNKIATMIEFYRAGASQSPNARY